jgi:hypothetical protein
VSFDEEAGDSMLELNIGGGDVGAFADCDELRATDERI